MVVVLLLAVGVCISVFVFVAVDSPDCDRVNENDAVAELVSDCEFSSVLLIEEDEATVDEGDADSVADTGDDAELDTLLVCVGVGGGVMVPVLVWVTELSSLAVDEAELERVPLGNSPERDCDTDWLVLRERSSEALMEGEAEIVKDADELCEELGSSPDSVCDAD